MEMPICLENNNAIYVRSIVGICRADLTREQYSGEFYNYTELFYIEQGTCWMAFGGERVMLSDGSLFVCGPGNSYANEIECDMKSTLVVIAIDVDFDLLQLMYNKPIRLSVRQREQMRTLINMGSSMFARKDADFSMDSLEDKMDAINKHRYRINLESFLLDISDVAGGENEKKTYPRREHSFHREMERLTDFLTENIDKNLSLKQMADALYVSESTFRRMVHRCEGCAPLTYFHNLKLRQSQELLQTTDLSVAEIASDLGFSSVHYFSRFFKARTGYSPSEYRKIWSV
ncbi:MAG: helix-turn-helix transcriptional regulator [Lachnospiraceae bacterium]|nr:helix-turn-helix transcriptional regulator [Lachnospiraceae bacterium]